MVSSVPIIGINTSLEPDADGGFTGLRPPYWEAIVRAGALPVMMPQLGEAALIDAFLDRVNGFLLAGGDDISSQRLGEPAPATAVVMDPRRERTDFLLLERLLARKMPTLAICLGFQELNVIHGGSLYQDLPYDGPPVLIRHYSRAGGPAPLHTITVKPGSALNRIWTGTAEATVNSCHHQGIRQLGGGLERVAWAPDGLTEAAQVSGMPFFLGVQWHPERMANDELQRKLFGALRQSLIK